MKVDELQIRTVATILIWLVAAMLILNLIFRSLVILLLSIIMMIMAIVAYFIPRLRKSMLN